MKNFTKATLLISIFYLGSCSPPDCENKKSEYKTGYSSGKIARAFGGSGGCQSYVNSHNNETGRNSMKATECFCDGYSDGNNNPSKF